MKSVIASVLAIAGTAVAVHAAAITPGNLVIYRVGTGSGALGTTAAAVFLDEYTTAGAFVQSIPLATTGTDRLTAVGNAATEGIISRSQDGTSLVFTGYRKDAGGTSPSADNGATTNRVIGTIGLAGTPNTTVALKIPTGTIRSATTVDSSTFYVSTSISVQYVGTPSGAATSTLIETRNSRQVNLSGNTLYASNGAAITGKVQHYGTLPTGATAATPVVTLATSTMMNGFFLCDLSGSIAGDDTLYCLDTATNALLKYTFDGSAWNADGSISAPGAANLCGIVSGGTASIFMTSAGSLFSFADPSGYDGTLSGTLGAAIATAGTNTAFRGIGSLDVIPTPGALGLFGAAGLLVARRRR